MENLTVVIPFRNGHSTLGRLLDSLPEGLPVIVVDDLSEPPLVVDTSDVERENVRVIRRETRGYFAGAVNTGIEAAGDSDVLVLNQDVWLEGLDWQKLIETHRGKFATIGDGVMGHPAFRSGYVQGTFMFLRRDALQRVGLLNVWDYPLWGCTAEWQIRACRAGFQAFPVDMRKYGMHHLRGDAPYGSSILQTLKDDPEQQSRFVRTPPAISVIITCYNYGRFLRDAVNSLVGGETSLGKFDPQSFQSFEIVIVDDGSTDNTREVAESLADDWKLIRYLRLAENKGSAAAMNAGIQASYGKLIAPLDADDMMETSRLETLYRAAEEHPHSVIYDDITAFADSKAPLDIIHPEAKKRPATVSRAEMWIASYGMPDYDFEEILVHNGMHKGILFERQAWKSVGGYPESFRDGREDWAFNVALGVQGYCGVHVREPLYLGRRHDANRTNTNGRREWRNYFVDKMKAQFPRLYAGERTAMCCGNRSKANGGNRSSGNGNGNAGTLGLSAMSGGARNAGRFAMSVGQSGMERLEFLLDKAGTVPYVGRVSGQQYVFGGRRNIGFVDARDVPAFLELVEARQQVFRRYQEPLAQTQTVPAENSGDAGDDVAPKDGLPETIIIGAGLDDADVQRESDQALGMFQEADSAITAEVSPLEDTSQLKVSAASKEKSGKPKTPRKSSGKKAASK